MLPSLTANYHTTDKVSEWVFFVSNVDLQTMNISLHVAAYKHLQHVTPNTCSMWHLQKHAACDTLGLDTGYYGNYLVTVAMLGVKVLLSMTWDEGEACNAGLANMDTVYVTMTTRFCGYTLKNTENDK